MKKRIAVALSTGFGFLFILTVLSHARAEESKTAYPNMAPLDQYLMERDAEIALARSAAPPSISKDADVMVLGAHGYETAVRGTNGFVCMVQRSWTAPPEDPGFWNPKLRGPSCFNSGGRSYVTLIVKKTDLVLAGRTQAQMFAAISAGIDKKELPTMPPGAMGYMMSKQQYLNDDVGHWHPHLMFFVPTADPGSWGADLSGSPLISAQEGPDRLTIFMVPVRMWSDGTPDLPSGH